MVELCHQEIPNNYQEPHFFHTHNLKKLPNYPSKAMADLMLQTNDENDETVNMTCD